MTVTVITSVQATALLANWWEVQQLFNASCGWANDSTSGTVWRLIDEGYRLVELGGNTCQSFGWAG
ncbi:hypothetical protein C9J22_07660 [Photobacterium phosphoreum]|uniref:hypothetical protein n=1 Tax=Photobacterium phosphoreum TaxID=659 RepID=UPI000D178AAC|nr:hypothetical protein [Photobacterium phosphoreum]PSU71103.1 hypothetical protein C9J22_07660 [Photobacterium phosphoreum]